MKSKDILVIVLTLALVGISIYRKYIKKNQTGGGGSAKSSSKSLSSFPQDDDYEPYSKK